MSTNRTLIIEEKFHGPPQSGNGGYVCGLTAIAHGAPCEVRLRMPPPLDKPLELVRSDDGRTILRDGDALVAQAEDHRFELEVPPALSVEEAREVSKRFSGFTSHIFPSCFVCGPLRDPGQGLRIFPGDPTSAGGDAAADTHPVAAPWTPDEQLAGEGGVVAPQFVWAALDCPGAFTTEYREAGRGTVLGSLACTIVEPVLAGRDYVVSGWPLGGEGRKMYAGTAVHDSAGRLCAYGKATWIWIDVASG